MTEGISPLKVLTTEANIA